VRWPKGTARILSKSLGAWESRICNFGKDVPRNCRLVRGRMVSASSRERAAAALQGIRSNGVSWLLGRRGLRQLVLGLVSDGVRRACRGKENKRKSEWRSFLTTFFASGGATLVRQEREMIYKYSTSRSFSAIFGLGSGQRLQRN
jgi:hypothetical protein